jgi:hypothetical protein
LTPVEARAVIFPKDFRLVRRSDEHNESYQTGR